MSAADFFQFDRDLDPTDARLGLTEAMRAVIAELASSTASDDAFEEARELVERAAMVLGERQHGRRYEGAEASLLERPGRGASLDFSPFVGAFNPLAPPIMMSAEGDEVIGTVTYGDAYEGPPGCLHGGFIAAGFDDVLGFAQSLSGTPGMTGRLTVSYRSPTPLHEPVRYVATLDHVDGRKIYAVATLRHGDRLCAEAEGLFISVKPAVFASLKQHRVDREC